MVFRYFVFDNRIVQKTERICSCRFYYDYDCYSNSDNSYVFFRSRDNSPGELFNDIILQISCDRGGGTAAEVSQSPQRSAMEAMVANNSAGSLSVTNFIRVSLKSGRPLK